MDGEEGLYCGFGGIGWVHRAIWREGRFIMGGSGGDEGFIERIGRERMGLYGDLEGGERFIG